MELNNKGFTLVEVLVIVAILAIIMGIAIPNVLSAISSSKDASRRVMINNIVSGCKTLYEEVNYADVTVYNYDNYGTRTSAIPKDSTIIVDLQTLVSNGYLNVTNNCNEDESDCKRLILDPKSGKNIGSCSIVISKSDDTYIISKNDSNEDCPSTDEYSEVIE